MNKPRPLRPVSSFRRPVQADQLCVSSGASGSSTRAWAIKSPSSALTTGVMGPLMSAMMFCISANFSILPRMASQKSDCAGAPISARRSATAAWGVSCKMRAFSRVTSSGSKRAGARPSRAMSKPSIISCRVWTGTTGSAVPKRAICAFRLIGSSPLSRKSASDNDPRRFDRPLPSAPSISEKWANSGMVPPSAAISSTCAAVFVTWSSPLMTWLIFISRSSTTLGRV